MNQQLPWTAKNTFTALLVVVIWGLNFVPMKLGLLVLSPFELGAARYLTAALPLCFIVRFPRVSVRWVFQLALFQGVGQFSLLFIGLQTGMTAALASIILQTQIYFTALLSFLIYRHRPTPLLWLSMGVATIGLMLFAVSALQNNTSREVTPLGIFYTLAAATMWGAANLTTHQAQHKFPNYNPLAYIVWSSTITAVVYLFFVALFTPDASRWLQFSTWKAIDYQTWLSVIYLGWASTIAGYTLWTLLLKRHPPNNVAPFSLGIPVIGLLAGLLWLKESIDYWQWSGSCFVGLSLLLVVFGPRYLKQWL